MQLFHPLHDSDLASAVWPYSCVFNYAEFGGGGGDGGSGGAGRNGKIHFKMPFGQHFISPFRDKLEISSCHRVILTSPKHVYVPRRAK